jgi:hypothetical protein
VYGGRGAARPPYTLARRASAGTLVNDGGATLGTAIRSCRSYEIPACWHLAS